MRTAHTVTRNFLLARPFDRLPDERIVRSQTLIFRQRIVRRVFEKRLFVIAKITARDDFAVVFGDENPGDV